MDSRVEWRSLSIVLHQEEVVRGTSFDLLLRHGVPFVSGVGCAARIVDFSGMTKLTCNMPICSRFE